MLHIRRTRSAIVALIMASALMFPALGADAQETRARVTGTITDTQGAVIPGVTVTATNTETNVSTETVANEAGAFTLQQLVPGPYRITATLQGFKTFAREGIVLHTAEVANVNVKLDVGGLEETVTVTAALSEAETNQSTLAQTMDNKQVSELPLNGRQVYMLLQLTSGTLFTQTSFGATGFSGTRAWDVNGSLSIHGSRTGNNEFLVDGAPSSGTGGGTGSWNYAPPVDAVEEFKVQTSSVDASYGRTSGGVVNLTLRSGTNQRRGSGIILHRGTWLDARQIQQIANNISHEDHKYYNAEGIFSGPIKRNKTFFMAGYQGFYENIPFPTTRTVPTEAQLRGDFSQTFTQNGQLIPIYDPATTRPNPSGTGFIRDPFPNNQIPQNRINPIAQALLQYVPRRNAPGTITGTGNFVSAPNLGRYRYNSYLTRIDHVFSNRHRISGSNTTNWGIEYRNENALPPPAIRSDNYPTNRNHYLITVDDTFMLSPITLWNTRVSWDRFDEPHHKEFGGASPSLPFTGPYQLGGVPFPQINIDGYEGMFPRNFRQGKNDASSFITSLSRTAGRHLMKVGAEARAYQFLRIDEANTNGSFTFSNQFTRRDPLSNSGAASGNGFATFLLGLPTSGNVSIVTPRTEQYLYYALYVQDDWKVGERATLNLGLRWDYQPPVTEKNDNILSGFDFAVQNPLQSQLRTTINPATGQPLDLRGGPLFANRGGPEKPFKGDWNNIQPRVSFSYKVTDRLVARTNYGRSYLGLSSSNLNGVYNTDFQRTTPFIAFAPNNVDPGTPWANPFPAGFLEPLRGEEGLLTGIGTGFTVPNADFNIPYADQWMAGIDIELPYRVGLDLAYVGNKVSEWPISRNINLIPQSERDKAIARLGGNPNYLNQTFPNPFAGLVPGQGLNAATVARSQLLRPFPHFGGLTMNRLNEGSTYYNALEAVATKRYSNGMMFAVNYTLMKMERQESRLNDYDAEPFRDLDQDMRRHNLTIVALVDLPFGPGRRFGSNTNSLLGHLIGGWQFNAIGEIRSGRPLAYNGSAILLDADGSAALPSSEQTFDRWFDNSTAQNPRPDGTYAWERIGANDYRQIGFRFHDVNEPTEPQWSISFFKNTRIGDRMNMQFRIETFNVFNTRIYGGPSTDPASATFGVINTTNQINFARTTQIGLRFQF